jgi:hypothetical protein
MHAFYSKMWVIPSSNNTIFCTTFILATVQLTSGKSMQSIYCRHNHVLKTNTKLCNIQLISGIHTKNNRGKDRQLLTNSRAFCNHALAIMVHWSSKEWMANWRGQPQCSYPGVFDLTNNWKTEETIYMPQWPSWFFLINGDLMLIQPGTYGRHDTWQLWLQSWCLEQWIIERTMMRSIIRKHDK